MKLSAGAGSAAGTSAAPTRGEHPWLLVEATSARATLSVRSTSSRGRVGADGEVAVEPWLEGRGDAERDVESTNMIAWDDAALVVRTSRLNTAPVYAWLDAESTRLLVGTDVPGLIARAIGMGCRGTDLLDQVREVRSRLRRLEPQRSFRFAGGSGAPTRIDLREGSLGPAWPAGDRDVDGETAQEAGRRQLAELARAIDDEDGGAGPVTALVSGGVDSAAVAAVACRGARVDGLATICTSWGDEAAHAAELGAALDLPLARMSLSEADLVDAVPETVRLLGLPSRDLVLVAVTLTSLYRSRQIAPGTLLTGYGSDIINSGVRTEPGRAGDVRVAVEGQLDYAARSGEFSGVAALAHGYRVKHPFWSPGVVRAALATAPDLMGYGGREKGHLRAAVGELLPADIAWRRKRAMHDGTGVLQQLEAAITRRSGLPTEDLPRLYDATLCTTVERLLADSSAHIDARECFDAAVELVHRQAA
jgi:asparagine synthetase B (glutamine-hydrolysing)